MKIWIGLIIFGIITFFIASFMAANNPSYLFLPLYGALPIILGVSIGFWRFIRRAKYE